MNQREQWEMSDDLKVEMRLSNDQLSRLEDLIKTSLKRGQELQDKITELSNQQGQQQRVQELRKEKKVEETKCQEWNKEKAAIKDSPLYKELQDLTKGLRVNKRHPLASPVKENVQSPAIEVSPVNKIEVSALLWDHLSNLVEALPTPLPPTPELSSNSRSPLNHSLLYHPR